jgi:hypothetical protein
MYGRSWLDRLVRAFQHRWETSAQYRAIVSGLIGLTLVILLCGSFGIVATVTNAALAGLGLTASQQTGFSGSQNTGTQQLRGVESFPTATMGQTGQSQVPPVETIPSSQTPVPSPTDAPTPTSGPKAGGCGGNCQGGGNGGGAVGTVSYTGSPNPWNAGQTVSVILHTSLPNIPVNVIVSNLPGGGTALDGGGNSTDGSGNYTYSFPCPASSASGTAKVTVMLNWPGGLRSYDYFQPYVP